MIARMFRSVAALLAAPPPPHCQMVPIVPHSAASDHSSVYGAVMRLRGGDAASCTNLYSSHDAGEARHYERRSSDNSQTTTRMRTDANSSCCCCCCCCYCRCLGDSSVNNWSWSYWMVSVRPTPIRIRSTRDEADDHAASVRDDDSNDHHSSDADLGRHGRLPPVDAHSA